MKNLSRIVLFVTLTFMAASCIDKNQRSTSTFALATTFEMTERDIPEYVVDSMMFSPDFSWEQITFFHSRSQALNVGYEGGFKFNTKQGGDQDTEEQSYFTSAGPSHGHEGSLCYLGYLQTYSMPDYDITFDYSQYYSCHANILGCYVNNSEYTMRLYESGQIQPGDFLKVTIEFFNDDKPVGSMDTYLVDYIGRELEIVEDWEPWDMGKQIEEDKLTVGNFNAVKFHVETSGGLLKPCFCLDNFIVQLSVEF